jgi:predicted amidohydrolase YtcJ
MAAKTHLRAALLAVVSTLAAGAAPAQGAAAPADLVYRNGYVFTADKRSHVRQAVAVRAGRVVYAGSDMGVKRFTGAATKVVDLHGRMLMPGLVDGHLHPLEAGHGLITCNLQYEPLTVAEFTARIQACLDATADREPDRWLEVVAWFQEAMQPAGTVLTHATLDALKTTRPIIVRSSFGHSLLANARALELARITSATPDPAGGRIARDTAGLPTGLFEDTAYDALVAQLPAATPAEDEAAARAALDALKQQGVTSFLDADASEAALVAFRAVERSGALTARAHFAPLIPVAEMPDVDAAVARVVSLANRYDEGPIGRDPRITVRNAKMFLDGVIAAPAQTGAMLAPYFVNAGTLEEPRWTPGSSRGPDVYFPAAVLKPLLIALAHAGLDPHLHADGDRAVHEALDAVAALRKAVPRADIRPAIAHDEIVDPKDFPRFKRLRAIAVLSLQWGKPASDTLEGIRDFLGPARARILEPSGLLVAQGAPIAFGSDWPVDPLDEWFALKVGVTRTNSPTAGPKYAGRLGLDPGLKRRTVLRAATIDAAFELHEERVTGSVERGKLADLIVLDRNPLTIPAEEIAHIKVLQTVVGGRIVYEAAALWR